MAVDPANPSNRKSQRIEVYAQAEVRGKDVSIMAVRNVSAGGVYLEGTPAEYPDLKPGTEIDLVIFGSEEGHGDDPDFNIVCKAKVIRIDPGFAGKRPPGFGVTIDPVGQENRDRLTNLLLRASGYRVGASKAP
jgi:PilZ domain-containing protein